MENISSPELIRKQATESIEFPETSLSLLTIGHVLKAKGIDLAIEAASQLKKKQIDFKWFFLGKIIESDWLTLIGKKGLSDNFVFLGIRPNPYPYIKAAGIYVHPSRFEGKSIALDEAKILCKPIVVTNFSTVNDQFEDRVNASICEMNGGALADAIIELATNKELCQSYVAYLNAHIVDNSSEVEKLYAFID